MKYYDYNKPFDTLLSMTTLNKNARLNTSPHYTDERFDKEQTVYGQLAESPHGHKHLEYVYSDRLWQWDYGKAKLSLEVANESEENPTSCKWYEVYLSAYLDKEIEIDHILAGVNRSSGYPYCVLGYKDKS